MKVLILAQTTGMWDDSISWIEEPGGQVVRAASAKQALRLLNADPEIDLIFIETGAGTDQGMTLLQTVKQDTRMNSLPVIVASRKFEDGTIRAFMGKGANDIMTLPITRDKFEARIQRVLEHGKKRILVVDDEPLIRDVLTRFLRLERFEPLSVDSGDKALEIVYNQHVDAVISDIVMPGMNGAELLLKIKEYDSEIPVILITGFSHQLGPDDAISMGADGFFEKPFHNVDLIYTLRRVLKRSKQRRSVEEAKPEA